VDGRFRRTDLTKAKISALSGLAAVARELRAAGVLRVVSGDLELELAPSEPGVADVPLDAPQASNDPLDDPFTYPGGRIPHFRKASP
jgi:hypothetical protein